MASPLDAYNGLHNAAWWTGLPRYDVVSTLESILHHRQQPPEPPRASAPASATLSINALVQSMHFDILPGYDSPPFGDAYICLSDHQSTRPDSHFLQAYENLHNLGRALAPPEQPIDNAFLSLEHNIPLIFLHHVVLEVQSRLAPSFP